MKNNMHYAKQYTADSTSVKFAALVKATTLFYSYENSTFQVLIASFKSEGQFQRC